jgi:hypothetical protein
LSEIYHALTPNALSFPLAGSICAHGKARIYIRQILLARSSSCVVG